MRLFVAILLDDPVKTGLCRAIDALKGQAMSGNFTRRENLHLTLAFLGETSRVEQAKQAVDAVSAGPFALRLAGFGRFERRGGDICWMGIRRCPELEELHRQLTGALRTAGFALEERAFRPHLTLGREVLFAGPFPRGALEQAVPPLEQAVAEIHLMKSERIGGRLTYTSIFRRSLRGEEGTK